MKTLREMVNAGLWYCNHCEKPVNISDDHDSPTRCPTCHKPTAVYIPAVFTPAEYEALLSGTQPTLADTDTAVTYPHALIRS